MTASGLADNLWVNSLLFKEHCVEFVKVAGMVLLIYVGLVAILEGLIGHFQPAMEGGVQLTTTDSAGRASDRMLAGFRFEENLYVSSNHWLRGWYRRALNNPVVEVVVDGESATYTAIRVEGEEHARLSDAYTMGFILRLACGFAPSPFLRLEPR